MVSFLLNYNIFERRFHTLFTCPVYGVYYTVKNYVAELIKTDDGLFDLLHGFISEATSQGINDYISRRVIRIDKKAISKLIAIDEVDRRITELKYRDLEEERLNIIKLYKNPPRDPWD